MIVTCELSEPDARMASNLLIRRGKRTGTDMEARSPLGAFHTRCHSSNSVVEWSVFSILEVGRSFPTECRAGT